METSTRRAVPVQARGAVVGRSSAGGRAQLLYCAGLHAAAACIVNERCGERWGNHLGGPPTGQEQRRSPPAVPAVRAVFVLRTRPRRFVRGTRHVECSASGLRPVSGFELDGLLSCQELVRRQCGRCEGGPGAAESSMVNNPEDPPKCRDMDLVDPDAVDEHRAPLRAGEAEERVYEGAVAGSRSLLRRRTHRERQENGAIEGRDGRGGIAHGRVEEPDLFGRPLHDGSLLRLDVDRLISERLDSPDSTANGRQIGPDPGGSDDWSTRIEQADPRSLRIMVRTILAPPSAHPARESPFPEASGDARTTRWLSSSISHPTHPSFAAHQHVKLRVASKELDIDRFADRGTSDTAARGLALRR